MCCYDLPQHLEDSLLYPALCRLEKTMSILLIAHSFLRWLIILVALVAVVKYLIGWLGKSPFKGMDRGLMSGFSGLMDLQATVGVLLLVWVGFAGAGFPLFRILHGVIMIVAAVVAHLSARWKGADDDTRFRNNLFTIVAALLLVFIGISVLSMA
jgi:uncharacterized membrane protein YphA (DoxX/SURF4 family)